MSTQLYTSAGIVFDYFPKRIFQVYFYKDSEPYKKYGRWIMGYLEQSYRLEEINDKRDEDFEVQFRMTGTETINVDWTSSQPVSFRGSEVIRIDARNQ